MMVTVRKGDSVFRVLEHTVNLWLSKGYQVEEEKAEEVKPVETPPEPKKRTPRRTKKQ